MEPLSITVDVFMGRSDLVITHELFHMQLWNQGFPMQIVDVPFPRTPTAAERKTAKILANYLHHRLFFPKMLLMGLDPYEENEKGFKYDFVTEGFVLGNARADPNFLAVMFLPELDLPPGRRKPFEEGFKKKVWGDYVELAKKLHTLILQNNPTTTVWQGVAGRVDSIMLRDVPKPWGQRTHSPELIRQTRTRERGAMAPCV
jgi:hypothetical protein